MNYTIKKIYNQYSNLQGIQIRFDRQNIHLTEQQIDAIVKALEEETRNILDQFAR